MKWPNIDMWQPLFASLALVNCTAADVPEIYHGRVEQTVLAVPSAIATSVLYDGESDWTPPDKPRSERTDRDAIRMIEFYVDLDQPGHVLTDQAARERLAAHSGTLHLPAIFGHVLGISIDFSPGRQSSAKAIRSQFGRPDFGPAFRALNPTSPEYGLATRRADWSKPVKGRELHGNSIFDVDVDYLSETENTYIYCNDSRQSVAPFASMPTCQFMIIIPKLGGVIRGTIDRGDVPRWRELRAAALATFYSFVVVSH
jgi:hypothetical protein